MMTLRSFKEGLAAVPTAKARSQHKSLGEVVSELVRRALGLGAGPAELAMAELERRNGFEPFPERTGPKVTVEGVQQICREEGISDRLARNQIKGSA